MDWANLAGGGDAAVGAMPGGRRLLPRRHGAHLHIERGDGGSVVVRGRLPARQNARARGACARIASPPSRQAEHSHPSPAKPAVSGALEQHAARHRAGYIAKAGRNRMRWHTVSVEAQRSGGGPRRRAQAGNAAPGAVPGRICCPHLEAVLREGVQACRQSPAA